MMVTGDGDMVLMVMMVELAVAMAVMLDVGGGAVVHVVFQDGNAKCWV